MMVLHAADEGVGQRRVHGGDFATEDVLRGMKFLDARGEIGPLEGAQAA
jgi:hypothetical protein